MFCKTVIIISMVVVSSTSLVWASDADYYITVGRQLMFDGTLSGLRLAYETFENGLNDPGCPDCNTNLELKFWHAVTGTTMLVFRDDNDSIDSVFELARQFDIEVLGNSWAPYFEPLGLDFKLVLNQYDAYEIPAGAPGVNEVRNIIDTSMIPEIEAIIADLNSISDKPDDRFQIFLEPEEVRIFFCPNSPVFSPGSPGYDPDSRFLQPLEVDYGEVLLLKGILIALKAQLKTQVAYDLYIDANDMLLEKFYGDTLNINSDVLEPHPDLLKVLPTANDANAGAAILAKARQDLIEGIDYYLKAIEYIRSEEDPQDDEFLYLDPNNKNVSDAINDRLLSLRDSILSDTIGNYPWKTSKIYNFQDPCSFSTTWLLTLNYGIISMPDYKPGSFVASDNNSAPSPWKVTDISKDGNEIMLEMEYDVPGYWGGALFSGFLSEDSNKITNGTFSYWGPDYGTIHNFSGKLVNTQIEEKQLDINPVFGTSSRYPVPINPRDLLPEFDHWNAAQPGTIGQGLGDDATLGGIMPDMTQYDWQKMLDLQPSGSLYLQEIYPWQRDGSFDGPFVAFWLEHQLVFEDPVSDTDENVSNVDNIDIDKLYIGYDYDYLYGAIILHDYNIVSSGQAYYNLYLSYTPDDTSSLDSIKLDMYLMSGMAGGSVCHMNDSYGYPFWWECMGMLNVRPGQNGIEFSVPWSSIPSYLPGRFISLNVSGSDNMWYNWNGEDNETHLRIGEVGTISGNISYIGYRGAPIFIQAYNDPYNPEESTIASTMILEPGPYTLEGIGLGWQGYVRAFTPLFGFNVFDLEAITIVASVSMFMFNNEVDGVDIVLNNPPILKKDIWVFGEIDTLLNKEDLYAFDAVKGGTYTLDVNRLTSQYASMALFGRDGHTDIEELGYWQTQQINWLCPLSGRYYIKVKDAYWQPEGGTYEIRMTSDLTCPDADIASADWVGVKDCKVDFYDFAVLASQWLNSCSEPYWCDESDFDQSRSIDFADFALLANEWLQNGIP